MSQVVDKIPQQYSNLEKLASLKTAVPVCWSVFLNHLRVQPKKNDPISVNKKNENSTEIWYTIIESTIGITFLKENFRLEMPPHSRRIIEFLIMTRLMRVDIPNTPFVWFEFVEKKQHSSNTKNSYNIKLCIRMFTIFFPHIYVSYSLRK